MLDNIKKFARSRNIANEASSSKKVEPFSPFPMEALPSPVREYVDSLAKAIGCDPSYIALPLLVAIASVIGNRRRLYLKNSWTVSAILWAIIVGRSGTLKTPAFKSALQVLYKIQDEFFLQYGEDKKEHEIALQLYAKEMAEWNRGESSDFMPPEKPELPALHRLVVSDSTIEAITHIFNENPNGFCLASDEITTWFLGFNRYGKSMISSSAFWLPMHSGESIIVDRKTGNPRVIHIQSACLSVCGGIQPGILRLILGKEHLDNGLAARILFAFPPPKQKVWTENEVDQNLAIRVEQIIRRLLELEPEVDDNDQPKPVVLHLTTEAKNRWIDHFDAHAEEQVDIADELDAAWSKLEETPARLALIFHLIRCAAEDSTLMDTDLVDEASMESAIKITGWFKHEARRVYMMFAGTEDIVEMQNLFEWIDRKGGSATVRQIQQGHRAYQTADAAEFMLNKMVAAELGSWVDKPPTTKGGRPTRVFELCTHLPDSAAA